MAQIIDPEQHADLITAQVAYLNAVDNLHADDVKDDKRPELRAAVREAGDARAKALRESGLIEEHGSYVAYQALMTAAHEQRGTLSGS